MTIETGRRVHRKNQSYTFSHQNSQQEFHSSLHMTSSPLEISCECWKLKKNESRRLKMLRSERSCWIEMYWKSININKWTQYINLLFHCPSMCENYNHLQVNLSLFWGVKHESKKCPKALTTDNNANRKGQERKWDIFVISFQLRWRAEN